MRTKCDDDNEKEEETVKCLWDRNANFYSKFAGFLCAYAPRIVFHWIIQIIMAAAVESAMHKTDGVVDKFQSRCFFCIQKQRDMCCLTFCTNHRSKMSSAMNISMMKILVTCSADAAMKKST